MVSASESAGVVHLITKEIRNPNGTKEKGIFVDEKLIYGKRTNTDGYYYTVGEAVKRDGGIFIKPSESRVVWLMDSMGRKFYRGSVNDQFQPHGKGYEVKDGCEDMKVYEGEYVNGEREGSGMLFTENGEIEKGTWKRGKLETGMSNIEERKMRTQFKAVKETDHFVQRYKKSAVSSKEICVFIGFLSDKRQKVAGRVYSDDSFNELLYEGYFKDGQYSDGTLFLDPRYTFTGIFENGKMKKGQLQLDKHVLYDGEVNEYGEMNGKGVLNTVDKNPMKLIDGQFRENKAHGFARVYYSDGSLKYCGFFKDGVMDGRGVLFGEKYAWMIGYQDNVYSSIQSIAETMESERGTSILQSNHCIPVWNNGDFLSGPFTIVTNHGNFSVRFEKNIPVKLVGGMYGKEWQIVGEAECLIDDGETYSPHSIDIGMMHVVLNGEVKMKNQLDEAICSFEKGELKHCKLFMSKQPVLDSDCYQDPKKEITGFDWIIPHGKGVQCLQKDHSIEATFENGMMKEVKNLYIEIGGIWLVYSGALADGYHWLSTITMINGRGKLMHTNMMPLYKGDIQNNVYQGSGKLTIYHEEKKENRFVLDMVYEGAFENGEFKSGRVTNYVNHPKEWDYMVTQDVTIENYHYNLVYEGKGKKWYWNKLVCGSDTEYGLFVMGHFICWGTKGANGLDGLSHWYAYSPCDLESVFTEQPISIEKRVKGLTLVKIQKHEHGKLVSISVTDRFGVETRFYPETNTGMRVRGEEKLYEGSMKQRTDANGTSLDEYVADGKGQSWDADGIYDGEWKDGMKSGSGKLILPDQSVIFGFWLNDKLDGKATVCTATGQCVTKKFKNGEDVGYSEYECDDEKYMLDKTMELEVKKGDQIVYKGQVISLEEACERVKTHCGSYYSFLKSSEEKLYTSILSWLQSGDNPYGFCLPYHDNRYVPHGKGIAYFQQSRYDGEFFCGVYHGNGKEWTKDVLLYDGSWAWNVRHGKGKAVLELRGPVYDCDYEYGEVKHINSYYVDNQLVFEGSFDKNRNPYQGTFYVIVCGHWLEGYMKKGLSASSYKLQGDDIAYEGSIQMNRFRFVLGDGTLTIGKKSFTGLFNALGDCEDCVVTKHERVVFEGSIKGLEYAIGKKYPHGKQKKSILMNGDEEGIFENGVLVDGYRVVNNVRMKVNEAVQYDAYLEKKRSAGQLKGRNVGEDSDIRDNTMAKQKRNPPPLPLPLVGKGPQTACGEERGQGNGAVGMQDSSSKVGLDKNGGADRHQQLDGIRSNPIHQDLRTSSSQGENYTLKSKEPCRNNEIVSD